MFREEGKDIIMSRTRATIAFDLDNMVPGPAGSSIIRTINKSEDGILLCYGTTAYGSLTDTDTYAPGCIYIDVNAGTVHVNSTTDITSAASFGSGIS